MNDLKLKNKSNNETNKKKKYDENRQFLVDQQLIIVEQPSRYVYNIVF